MIPQRDDLEVAKHKLHELNSKVLTDPDNKLLRIKEFYAEQSPADADYADIALIIYSIAAAGADNMVSNQTTHLKAAAPVFLLGMILAAVLSLSAIAVGAYAIYKNAFSATELHMWGTSLSTSSVGVAMIFIGVVGAGWTIRKAFKYAAFSHPPIAKVANPSTPSAAVDLLASRDDASKDM